MTKSLNIRKSLIKFIGEHKLKEAFDLLEEHIDEDFQKELTITKAKWTKNDKENREGVIDKKDYDIIQSIVIKNLLLYSDKLKRIDTLTDLNQNRVNELKEYKKRNARKFEEANNGEIPLNKIYQVPNHSAKESLLEYINRGIDRFDKLYLNNSPCKNGQNLKTLSPHLPKIDNILDISSIYIKKYIELIIRVEFIEK